jgi:hypothetical protein
MSLTKTGDKEFRGVPVTVDEDLPKPPLRAGRLKFKERYSMISNYLRPILDACPVKPVSVGVFGGSLDYSHLKWWGMSSLCLSSRPRLVTSAIGMPSVHGQAACRHCFTLRDEKKKDK